MNQLVRKIRTIEKEIIENDKYPIEAPLTVNVPNQRSATVTANSMTTVNAPITGTS